QVHIVGSMEKFAPFGSVIEDVIPQCGPLGGIYSALGATSTDRNLILAVDLPFMNASFLHYLTSRSAESDAVVTVPRLDGRWQPLCAVYRKTFRDHAQAALRDGNNRIDAVYPSVVVSIVNDAEIDRAGFSPELFRNLNTPEDWEQARHRL
ncbi:MAG TPA: molybdenum cofactor guanylyltransferase, partial [Terriglobales bacterium]